MPNRLASETSPYLLQHANNPVDWYPWGEEAFAKARAEGKPIFLSVGYSSCHWCHVMEHESFEDEAVARQLNENFVNIKVDREERPDVDEAYMAAVQLTSGRGGWPMSVFLTPDKKPFFAGTYFPKEDRGQYPGFISVISQLHQAWSERRQDVERAASQFSEGLKEAFAAEPPDSHAHLDQDFVNVALRTVLSEFDAENGGFGGAPKFPPHTGIEFLLLYALQPWAPMDLREAALGASALTLEKMCLGGIHDHVGGGFHRYSTDEKWLLPHFEKMLYDNALMLGNLARAAGLVQPLDSRLANLYIDAAQGIIDWASREMLAPEGWFYSALDADSEGEEGKFYVWTESELREVLGDKADAFISAFRIETEGNFLDEATHEKTGSNIPHLADDVRAQFDDELAKLRLAREHRIRPGLDDKALVSWNGLMIGSLAEGGMWSLAEGAALALLKAEQDAGYLPHSIAKGKPSGLAYLDDYACLADGLIKLAALASLLEERGEHRGSSSQTLVSHAARLCQEMVDKFYDPAAGGFFGTSAEHEELFGRRKPVFDQPVPSGNAVALRVLLALGVRDLAEHCAAAMIGWMHRAPQATEGLFAAWLPLIPSAHVEESAASEAPVAAPFAEVQVSMTSRELRADAEGKGTFTVRIQIPEGLHINSSEPPARWLTPTTITTKPVSSSVRYPEPANDEYVGTLEFEVVVSLKPSEAAAEFELSLQYQACTQTECLAPAEKRFDCVLYR